MNSKSTQSLLELCDITLIPSPINNGWRGCERINYLTRDLTGTLPDSLPIFTSPMDSVVDDKNWRIWANSNINSVIPRTVNFNTRVNLSQGIFSAFSFDEVKSYFLDQDRRYTGQQYKICLDIGNGHDSWILELASKLKNLYGKQMILMGGNIENPESYVNYSKAGFDFVRIGMTSGSLVMKDKFGFNYPTASLILDTCAVREKSKSIGIRPINIIVDGGISSFTDLIKCIALGADYVMMGRELVKILEAAGSVFSKTRTPEGIDKVEEILKSTDLTEKELKDLELVRLYSGNTTLDTQRIRGGFSSQDEILNPKIIDAKCVWVSVTKRLDSWLSDLREHIRYSFMMSNSRSWQEFKTNIKYGKL